MITIAASVLAATVPPPVPGVADNLLLAVDLVGIFVFGLSGGLLAVRKQLDVFGIAVLAVAAALGGGVLRDLLIGAVPPAALLDWRYGAAALAAAALAFLAHGPLERLGPAVRLTDAVGLGFFAVAGTSKALAFGVPAYSAVVMGVVTAVGGGVIRDLLAGEVPLVLRREIYAVAAIAGSMVVAVAAELEVYGTIAAMVAVAFTFAIRVVAVAREWNAPTAPSRGSIRP